MERLALENARSLEEFFELIDPSSWMDVAPLEATLALVKPGLATMEFARSHHHQWSTAVWWRMRRSDSIS